MGRRVREGRRGTSVGLGFFARINRRLHASLALVVSPLRALVGRCRSSTTLVSGLGVIRHGTLELLGLMGRLLSFEGVSIGKCCLDLSSSSVVSYVRAVYSSFVSLSRGGSVSLVFRSTIPSLGVLFSKSGVERIVVGLLSGTLGFAYGNKQISISINLIRKRSSQRVLRVEITSANINVGRRGERHVFRHFCRISGPSVGVSSNKNNLDVMHSFIALRSNAIGMVSGAPINYIFIVRVPMGHSRDGPAGVRRIRIASGPMRSVSALRVPRFCVTSGTKRRSRRRPGRVVAVRKLRRSVQELRSNGARRVTRRGGVRAVSTITPRETAIVRLVRNRSGRVVARVVPPRRLPRVIATIPRRGDRRGLGAI